MAQRRFPAPWRAEQIPGGYKVLDATGQALAYIYAREKQSDADIAHALTFDEARRIAVNVAKLRGMEIDKQTATRRLIHAAIRLACQREDPLAIHILIMSAHDVIRDCAEARGKHLENSIQPQIPADQRKEVRDSLKEMHHFLRHAKEDADKTPDVSEIDSFNDALIAVTCQMHKELFHENTGPMKLFGVLTVINYPHLMPDEHEALRRFLTERNLPAWDELNAMSRDERYQRARTLLEIDRALRSEIEH